ncbi:MAG TPA: TonB-dependent receptor [Saprospiraceae bacterium]|nr:TonB-dependent receptor [Saprospiraceae bacterium]HQW55381.1 TonB-dependent receptor [Saprospiraceae bacterium]
MLIFSSAHYSLKSYFIFSMLMVLSLSALTAQVIKQDTIQPQVLKEVNITGSWATSQTPVTQKTIRKSSLQTASAKDIPVLLESLPSALSSSDAGNGVGYTYLRIRGSDQTRINVTLDGVPVNDAESQNVFWVDLPDMIEDAAAIQVQRGLGLSAAGPGAFGANINLQTSVPTDSFGVGVNTGLGSFDTKKINLTVNSGSLGGHFKFKVRGSRISSAGYIDRASSNLWASSFQSYLTLGQTSIQANVYYGKEKTYQAWVGVPYHYFYGDKPTYNPAGLIEGNTFFDDETDNFTQVYSRVIIKRPLNDHSGLQGTLYHTYGGGYYNQYKPKENLSDYFEGQNNIADLIRERWLKNNLFGLNLNYYLISGKMTHQLGGNIQTYGGSHFGIVRSVIGNINWQPRHYYDDNAIKTESSVYYKNEITLNALTLMGDMQVRLLRYQYTGYNAEGGISPQKDKLAFFNPKMGASYAVNNHLSMYGYTGLGHREPNRDDYTESPHGKLPKPEQLLNVEVGLKYAQTNFNLQANYFGMFYKDQLILTGQINDVGAYTRINAEKSRRTGVELETAIVPFHWMNIVANLTLSKNIINSLDEYIDVSSYSDSSGIQYLPQEQITHRNTDISFSPDFISFGKIEFKPFSLANHLFSDVTISYDIKYISRQFLNNYSNETSILPAYSKQGVQITWPFRLGGMHCSVTGRVNNLLNSKIISNGWVYRYKYLGPSYDDPSTVPEGNNYYSSIGFFPEAGRNYFINLQFNF